MSDFIAPNFLMLQRFLHVCKFSGYRRLGLLKRIQENKNLIRVLFENLNASKKSFWTVEYALSVDNFFNKTEQSVNIVRSLPPWESDLGMKIIYNLCGIKCKSINNLQQTNRKLACCIHGKQKHFADVAFIERWLEDHELFFEDLKNAIHENHLTGNLRPWAGRDYSDYLLKFDSC